MTEYERGRRGAFLMMLQECIRALGYDENESSRALWIQERESAVSTLRDVCEHHGDNDWPSSLNLADVVEKHLHRHLGEVFERGVKDERAKVVKWLRARADHCLNESKARNTSHEVYMMWITKFDEITRMLSEIEDGMHDRDE